MDVTANEVHSHHNPLNILIWRIASRFGDRAKEVDRFIKFAVVGVIGSIVDFGMLNLLERTLLVPEGPSADLKVALATGIAFTSAVISNFIWNRYWTFPESRANPVGRQLLQFSVISVVGLIFRLFFVSLSYRFFGHLASSLMPGAGETALARLGSNIAQAISIAIVLFWNFFANRYWTYRDVK